MTLATLAIHAEAWLQEELAAQRSVLAALAEIEGAARAGSSDDFECAGRKLHGLLALAGPRDARRGALLGRLAAELRLPAGGVTLSKVSAELAAAEIETQRLEVLRVELREVAAAVVKASRRLAALARYHRGVLEELCSLFHADAPGRGAHLVDAQA